MGRLYSLADAPQRVAAIERTLGWMSEAGQPFFDWFFGSAAATRRALVAWMRRPSSELFVGRVRTLVGDGEHVGGYVALSGVELERCRRADGLAVLRDTLRADWPEIPSRVRASQQLFSSVDPDECYLSKLGIDPALRGLGWGRRLVEQALADGARDGFTRFHLDVWEGNEPARRLYERVGFEVVGSSWSETAGLTYLALTLGARRSPTPPDG
jgi:ribosomal protein S18 acetylase RimI-like enzyme